MLKPIKMEVKPEEIIEAVKKMKKKGKRRLFGGLSCLYLS